MKASSHRRGGIDRIIIAIQRKASLSTAPFKPIKWIANPTHPAQLSPMIPSAKSVAD
jgi:hypothetical protein